MFSEVNIYLVLKAHFNSKSMFRVVNIDCYNLFTFLKITLDWIMIHTVNCNPGLYITVYRLIYITKYITIQDGTKTILEESSQRLDIKNWHIVLEESSHGLDISI